MARVRDFPHTHIEIACFKCPRRGRYLIAKFNPDTQLPDLLSEVSKDCPRSSRLQMLDRCGSYFPQLVTKKGPN